MRNDLAVGVVIGLGLGFIAGYGVSGALLLPMENRLHAEAVKHGAATWVVADDGSTTFKWKDEKKEK